MRKTWQHPALIGLAVLLGGAGCSKDPTAGRQSLDLEQAFHGHWSSTRDLDLAPGAGPWDTSGATERWHTEIDLYIDAQSEPKGWREAAGDRGWRTRTQEPAGGLLEIETWVEGRPAKSTTRELQFSDDRSIVLERLRAKAGQPSVREWIYINADARP